MRIRIGLVPVALFALAIFGGFSPSQAGDIRVIFPQGLKDEKGNIVNQPVLVELHELLTPVLRAERIEPLMKELEQADTDVDKQKIQVEIEHVRTADALIVASDTLEPGGNTGFEMPPGDYEVHFIAVNPPDREPIILRVTHQSDRTVVTVQVAPEGAIIGGGPSVAELLKRIEDQQQEIAGLTERIQKLEDNKKP